MLLQGKNIIVTGTNRGIGKAMVEVFARQGANVWACARKPSEEFEAFLQQTAAKNNVTIAPVYFELTNSDEVKASLRAVFAEKKPIDALVNCAGAVSPNALFAMTSIDVMRNLFEVNFFAQMYITQLVSRIMSRQKSGSIVFLSSVAGLDGDPGQLEYCASKSAIAGATKKLAHELGPQGIRVNAIAPGLTDTDMAKGMSDDLMRQTIDSVVLKRLGKPEEIANADAFLVSDFASYITGQVIRVDGGR